MLAWTHPFLSSLQRLTLGSKHDEPPLEVEIFIWLLPLSASLSVSPTADEGRLWDDTGRLPEAELLLFKEELAPPPLRWYSMGDWRAVKAQRQNMDHHQDKRTLLLQEVHLCRMCFLTGQEVALSVQDFLDVSDPDLLNVDVGCLQGEALR